MNNYEEVKFGPAQRKRRGVYVACEICEREFYVTPARLRATQKKGVIIRFCSMTCRIKTLAGEGNPFWGKKHSPEVIQQWRENPKCNRFRSGEENPNVKRFGLLPAANSGHRRWRRYLIATRGPHCERCKWGELAALLQVHHQDRNRENNTEDNLRLLCLNCHYADHYLAGDGPYTKDVSKSEPA